MAQLNLYVPDDLAAKLKKEAERAHMSLSGYVVQQLSKDHSDDYPPGYFERVCGFLKEDFPEILDPPPEPLTDLESLD
ncbi:MAG: hypothetical protein HYX27_28675 [Acidobacteria bacterium]|nr:hypothetical protein [Acidobacteriota bacterium]